jgi:hypothetical protein
MSGDHNQYQKPDKCDRCGEVNPAEIHTCTPKQHWSDCAVHSEPAYPAGECDCSGFQPEKEPVAIVDVSDGRPFVCVHDQTLKAGTPLYTSPHSATHSADSADSFCKSEPVAWTVRGLITDFSQDFSAYQTKTYTVPLYTAPPQREWKGLTDEDWIIGKRSADYVAGAEWAEAKLKEKNT